MWICGYVDLSAGSLDRGRELEDDVQMKGVISGKMAGVVPGLWRNESQVTGDSCLTAVR